MRRTFMFLAIGAALVSAFALYTVSYQTRGIADDNERMEGEIARLNRDIAILRAERAYLMRPERIEPLARNLGMRPIRGNQFMSASELPANTRRP